MHISWEPESSLPESVVREFENGYKVKTNQNTTSYGLQSTTLVPSAVNDESLPSTKKVRLDRENTLDGNTGYKQGSIITTCTCNFTHHHTCT